jgi:hypothetical protein
MVDHTLNFPINMWLALFEWKKCKHPKRVRWEAIQIVGYHPYHSENRPDQHIAAVEQRTTAETTSKNPAITF